MATCGNCQSETTRLTAVLAYGDKWIPEGQRQEACPNCRPELFAEPFAAPIDRKVWPEHEAKPYLYEQAGDGSWRAKDVLLADLDAAWQADPDAEATERAFARKRAQRRTRPLEPWEIEQAERVWRPIVKQMYADQAQQIEADRLYTENRIEQWKRDESTTVQ
jgi:hypothetical protein